MGQADILDELLSAGVDLRRRNADGNNALWLACVSDDAHVVQRLIKAGIDIDNQNDAGATALMYTASAGKATLCQLLLDAGASPHLRNQDDFQAIDLASTWECLKALRS